jgi:hypothetical protein
MRAVMKVNRNEPRYAKAVVANLSKMPKPVIVGEEMDKSSQQTTRGRSGQARISRNSRGIWETHYEAQANSSRE